MKKLEQPSLIACFIRSAIDMKAFGISSHFARKKRQQMLVAESLNAPHSAIFRRTIAPLKDSPVWGGLVSALKPDGTRSSYTRYLVYLNEPPDHALVIFDGSEDFCAPSFYSDPEIFQQKWELFQRI